MSQAELGKRFPVFCIHRVGHFTSVLCAKMELTCFSDSVDLDRCHVGTFFLCSLV